MLDTVFLQILNMSFTACFVIAAVLLLRLLLKKAPRRFSYLLWAVVLLRLVCPFTLESAWSLIRINPAPLSPEVITTDTPRVETGLPAVDAAVNEVLSERYPATAPVTPPANDSTLGDAPVTDTSETPVPDTPSATVPTQPPASPWASPVRVMAIVWLCGMAVMALYSVVSLLRLHRRLVGAMRLRDNIWLADHIHTPFVLGVFRPRIYLPSSTQKSEQGYILLHEQNHIRHGDHIVRLIAFAVLAVYWFHPLVWVAFLLSMRDMEMACDESVLRTLGEDIRTEYSQSLLSFATGRHRIAATPLAFGEGDPKSRIRHVLHYKKPALWAILAGVVACCVAAVCLLTTAAPKKPPEESGEESTSESAEESAGSGEEILKPNAAADFQYTVADNAVTITKYIGTRGNVVIPASIEGFPVVRITSTAFWECDHLTEVTIPEGVTTIEAEAFFHLPALARVTIPQSVTDIGRTPFSGCPKLLEIAVDKNNPAYTSVDGVLYNKNMTNLINCPGGKTGRLTIPDGVTHIEDLAFYRCESLVAIIMPDSVTGMGSHAFQNCRSLEEVILSKSLAEISPRAFQACESLESVTIPNDVVSIGVMAFADCDALVSVTIPDSVTGISDIAFGGGDELTIYCSEGSYAEAYAKDNGIRIFVATTTATTTTTTIAATTATTTATTTTTTTTTTTQTQASTSDRDVQMPRYPVAVSGADNCVVYSVEPNQTLSLPSDRKVLGFGGVGAGGTDVVRLSGGVYYYIKDRLTVNFEDLVQKAAARAGISERLTVSELVPGSPRCIAYRVVSNTEIESYVYNAKTDSLRKLPFRVGAQTFHAFFGDNIYTFGYDGVPGKEMRLYLMDLRDDPQEPILVDTAARLEVKECYGYDRNVLCYTKDDSTMVFYNIATGKKVTVDGSSLYGYAKNSTAALVYDNGSLRLYDIATGADLTASQYGKLLLYERAMPVGVVNGALEMVVHGTGETVQIKVCASKEQVTWDSNSRFAYVYPQGNETFYIVDLQTEKITEVALDQTFVKAVKNAGGSANVLMTIQPDDSQVMFVLR